MAQQAPQPSSGGAPASSNVSAGFPLGQSVIPLVNKLQDIFAQLGSASTVDLPQVAVVGSQSSGKSSVLEALVGRDFLPRNTDICTRRPLVLQLIQIPRKPDDKPEIVEWGEFLHAPGKRFTDFSLIRKEIEDETEREVGSNKGISDKQIRLKIFSPHVLNITLVDLPGITKVPVGDQPSDIESRVRTMIHNYIKHETCIILAVSPANADLANSDALQMARMADPEGTRTIGVITKLDIMDRGTDARNFLLGNVIPLRLGYIGVVNRSQEDILANKSIRDALVYEENFFRSRPVYSSLADRCGIPQLAKKLNYILVQHIKTILPDMKARINMQIVSLSKELQSYGELTESKSGQAALLLNILSKYSQGFTTIIDGKNEEVSTAEVFGGSRLHYIFQSIFVKTLDEIDPCDDLSDEDIRTAIQNATGARNAIFVPEVPFEALVRRQIYRLLDPSLQCARFIYDELIKIAHRCETSELQRFPVLRRRVEEVVIAFLNEGLRPAESIIIHLIEMETDYINTSHPNFIGGPKAVELACQQRNARITAARIAETTEHPHSDKVNSTPASERLSKPRALLGRMTASGASADHGSKSTNTKPESSNPSGSWGISSIFGSNDNVRSVGKEATVNKNYSDAASSLEPALMTIQLKEPPAFLKASDVQSEHESIEITVTRLLIRSYYDIVRRKIQDAVPKAIMRFLVNRSKRELHNIFIRKLYRENLYEEMLQEREDIAVKRKRCKEVLRVLQQAAHALEEVPLECEILPSKPSILDENGVPPSLLSNDTYGTGSQSPGPGYMSTPKHSKSKKSSLSGEQPSLVNGGPGVTYPSIYS